MPSGRHVARVGAPVRLPLDDWRDYRSIAYGLGDRPVSRVLVTLVLEVTRPLLTKGERLEFNSTGLIPAIQQNTELVAICRRIVDRGMRSLSNAKTQAVWLGFKESERAELSTIWHSLRWTEGKLFLESLRDAMVLGSQSGAPVEAPTVATLFWGSRLFKRQVESDFLDQISIAFEKARLAPNREERQIENTGRISVDPGLSIK